MLNAQKYIEIVKSRGERKRPLNRVFRMIRHRDLFLAAYSKLYANNGATTAGTNPEDTVDGMSLNRIDRIRGQLAAGTFRWTPVKRVYMDKKQGGKRPLGLPGWNDKLVQEVLRMLLEAYYEPQFADSSHGFRPGRGCHTALEAIRRQWRGTTWFIEGDIEGCFDNIDHTVLMDIIERDIHDQRLSKLLRDMLEAGYMEEWRHHRTYSGTVQGGVISPLLANIVLNELDQFVENTLIPRYTRGKKRRGNPEYHRLSWEMTKARKRRDKATYQRLERQRQQIPSGDPYDDNFRRLRYCRYADDFILGFIGPKREAETIKAEIAAFLATLKLTLSPEKTLITHAVNSRARFLGYELHVVRNDHCLTYHQVPKTTKIRARAKNGEVVLGVPRDVAQKWRSRYTRRGKPIHKSYLLNSSDYDIVRIFDHEFRGLVNYYSLAFNVSRRLGPVRYVCLQSLMKTLAGKHKRRSSWVYRRYTQRLADGRKVIQVTVSREAPKKPRVATFGAQQLRCRKTTVIKDTVQRIYPKRTELLQRLLADECELCGSTANVEVHHIRKLADLRLRYRGQRSRPEWVTNMLARRRKTIVVCRRCHRHIHNGTYDGPKLT